MRLFLFSNSRNFFFHQSVAVIRWLSHSGCISLTLAFHVVMLPNGVPLRPVFRNYLPPGKRNS